MSDLQKLHQFFLQSTGVCIDSRNAQAGNIFFALQGEHSDGNKFATIALEKGALLAVVDKEEYVTEQCFFVKDALVTLQQLSSAYRAQLNIPIIAITGSNGKTTTKELSHEVLKKKYKVFATKGNLNNHIGVPLSLLSIKAEHEIAIIEMGANHLREIESLCEIAQPDFGLITNIGKAHLEGFGGPEGVKKGKSELYLYVMRNKGLLFVNSGQHLLSDIYEGYEKVVKYGFNSDDFLSGKITSELPFASLLIDGLQINSHLVGQYNAENILAAVCIGKYFGVALSECKSAIESYFPENSRSEWKEIQGNYFILDAYNANPSSMKAAIENFIELNVEPKVLIIGDMLEMGEYAMGEHSLILDIALQGNFQEIITVGKEFYSVTKNNVHAFLTTAEAKSFFDSKNYQNTYFLLKGSRGIAIEKILG